MGLRDTLMMEMWEAVKPGETVLIEKKGEGDMAIGTYHTVSWAKSKGFDVVIVDVLDSFSTLISKTKLIGFDGSIFDGVKVIKIGGVKDCDKAVACIKDISEPVILSRKFKEAYERLLDRNNPVFALIVGLEKLFVAQDLSPQGVQTIVNQFASHVGDKRRIGVYFLRIDPFTEDKNFIINLLEDVATTVIKTSKTGRMMEFHIVKSLNRELEGVLIRI